MDSKKFEKILDLPVEEIMKKSYIEYAMSVIVSRALPDVRDGLKPVHRRILYAMNELNLDPSKPYKKSARIVGDTMGKFHPHGDSAIYDSMVRMAQDFSMRYMLVDGHGNFGSVDGDSAAASRYTEARLSKISMNMLSDIDKDTVDFIPNYTEEFKEPVVLPSRFPNLLVNGSSGIAVGMATNIPPHNLGEVIDAVVKLIDNFVEEKRETEIEELLSIVKGPDFPTSGNILGTKGIKQAYRTGRGKVVVRANAVIEERNNRNIIVVDELPFQVNKSKLLERIAELVKDKKIDGISDLREESDRNGMRIVVEIKKDANAKVVLNNLYKHTSLQDSFGINMLALVDNEPKVLNLKQVLEYYLLHQKEVVTRRTQFELNKARKREHILQGYVIALSNIDEVIKIIRGSKDTADAKSNLMERFGFSIEQVTAIVEMPLRSLTGLEQDKIQKELNDLEILIKKLLEILNDENVLYAIIKTEILEIRNKYADERKSRLIIDPGEIEIEDLIDDEPNVVTLTTLDYIKRLPLSTYKSQHRGGKGIKGIQTKDEDIVSNLFVTNAHSSIMFFTNKGRVHIIKTYEIPEVSRTARGMAIVNLLNLNPDETIAASIPINGSLAVDDLYLMMITKKGIIKKTDLTKFSNLKNKGLQAINIAEDDEVIKVLLTDGKKEIFIVSKFGKSIRFDEKQIRSVGRTAAGVSTMRLSKDDFIIGACCVDESSKVLFVTEFGFGKCTEFNHFRTKSRRGKGTGTYKITDKTGPIVGVTVVNDNEELIIINSNGLVIRLRIADISTVGRIASGVKLINLAKDVTVKSIAKINEEHLEEEEFEIPEIIEESPEIINTDDIDL